MESLKKSDFIIALIFGFFISLICIQFRSLKNQNKVSVKNIEVQQASFSSHQDPRSYKSIFTVDAKSSVSRVPKLGDNTLIDLSKERANEEYINTEVEFSDEEAKAQLNQDIHLPMDVKIENYLLNQVGLTPSETARVIVEKKYMEDEMNKNKMSQSLVNSNDKSYVEFNILNRQILSNYHEVLKQIMGPENYYRYSIWQNEQDLALTENNVLAKKIDE